jgi:hypothetical protein
MEAKIDIRGDEIKIYIDNLLHLSFKEKILAIQSYNEQDKFFCIEFTLSTQTIKVEYDEMLKWKEILKLIDTI